MIQLISLRRVRPLVALVSSAGAVLLGVASPAAAADLLPGWGTWWLPPDRSTHGAGIDSLFLVTFWITMVTFVAVEVCLVVFLIKYRSRPGRPKAHYTHGNTRLEMAWTLAPALILAGLAVANKGVWDRLRFNPEASRADKATILVIGQQFKWNVIYPGKDGKLGRYMLFPKPSDARWPGGVTFAGVKGPAELKYADAVAAINKYAELENPLGKDFDDPDGKDDDWSKTPGRELVIPADRPTEVQLTSKDVIHSFFLPNHRVKLDAVPGMRGKIVFTATMTSKQREELSRKTYKIDELAKLYEATIAPDLSVVITKETPGAVKAPGAREDYLYAVDPKAARPVTIVRNGRGLTKENVAKLKAAGITEVTAYEPGYWDIVCEELCGLGHYTMQGRLVVLSSDEYNKQFEGGRSLNGTPAATQPTNLASATK
ncbi:MAG TPA: cytochrome c oxidase subunit II transmembrane domain-containing protein [Tepidisphaeraceae bacterium]|nr:cytochrome c oxidase subunit II transmembrane domain-containing protein [Tepidisphaeraceae bacterium]